MLLTAPLVGHITASTASDDTLTGKLTSWVESVIDAIGYAGVALLVALESVFPPIPSEVVLPAAGIWASERDGVLPLLGMIVASTIGSVVGAWVLYWFAALVGPVRLRSLVARHGRWFGLKVADVDRAEAWFDHRGDMAVLLCRCLPLVRSLVSIPAGCARMAPARFTLYTTLGSLVWNSALILVGYAAADQITRVEGEPLGTLQYVIAAVIVVGVAAFVWRRRRDRMTAPDVIDGA